MTAEFDMKASMSLTDGTLSRDKLESFLAATPKTSSLRAEVRTTEPDRQGETRVNHISLVARWKLSPNASPETPA